MFRCYHVLSCHQVILSVFFKRRNCYPQWWFINWSWFGFVERTCFPKDIVNINDIKNNVCPKGGCWERILLISEYVQNYFVIQLDADTLTLGDIPKVLRRVSDKTSFTLPTPSGPIIETMRESNERIKDWPENHVQVRTEKNSINLKDTKNWNMYAGAQHLPALLQELFLSQNWKIFLRKWRIQWVRIGPDEGRSRLHQIFWSPIHHHVKCWLSQNMPGIILRIIFLTIIVILCILPVIIAGKMAFI